MILKYGPDVQYEYSAYCINSEHHFARKQRKYSYTLIKRNQLALEESFVEVLATFFKRFYFQAKNVKFF